MSCLLQTCTANGWLRVTIGPDGCVASLEMDEPDEALIACMVAELGPIRCPCLGAEQHTDIFLGIDHPEVPCDNTGEQGG